MTKVFGNIKITESKSIDLANARRGYRVVFTAENPDQIKILNVAGNTERTHPGCQEKVEYYLGKVFEYLGVNNDKGSSH